jgi:hypothetical protein
VQPVFRKRWTAAREYSEAYGLRLDTRQIYGRLLLSGGAAFYSSRYADSYVHNVLKGTSWNVYLQARYILTGRTFLQAGLDFMREEANVRAYGHDDGRYSLAAYHAFPYGISLFAGCSLTRTRHHASQWYVTRDNRIAEAVRRDTTWQIFASLSSNVFERHGLTPILQYTHTRRHSNIWTRNYERHRLDMTFNYRL